MFNIGDKFVSNQGRGYFPIWVIVAKTFHKGKCEMLYDLLSIRINEGAILYNMSEDTLKTKFRRLNNESNTENKTSVL